MADIKKQENNTNNFKGQVPMVPIFHYPGMENGQTPILYMPPTPNAVETLLVDNSQENLQKEAIIKSLTPWVIAHLTFQMILGIFGLMSLYFIFFIINTIAFSFAIKGLRLRHRGYLLFHFVYSLLLLFAVIVITVVPFFYYYSDLPTGYTLFSLVIIGFLTICLRKERILIQMLPKKSCCSRSSQPSISDIEQQQQQQGNNVTPIQVPMFIGSPSFEQNNNNNGHPFYYPMTVNPNQFQFGSSNVGPFVLAPAANNVNINN